jgi:energy-coupling factor transporter ATP-binding protein EcfA2
MVGEEITMIYGNLFLDESYLINKKDILYNKEKFDSGEINLCFVIGHSGSGKSTLAHKAEDGVTIEAYELDDIQTVKDHFTMANLKEYGDLIYSYFNGPGKKFYVTYDELVEKKVPGSEYEDVLFPDFVHYAMRYAKMHKDKKFYIEGVWLFHNDEHGKPWFTPEEFKDYAFYIKGTSMIISKLRAAKRDSSDATKNGKSRVKEFFRQMKNNWKWYLIDEKRINVFRDYFTKLMKKKG